jgi:hypothetical protein
MSSNIPAYMSSDPKHDLDRLKQQLRVAPALDARLVAIVVSHACTRLPVLKQSGKAAPIDRLIAAGAWSDVALALIELELPAWKLRRLIYEDGEWFCSLSRQPNLPVELDDTADARHEVLPLAILSAFIEARGRTRTSPETSSTAVPQIWPTSDYMTCCDYFT